MRSTLQSKPDNNFLYIVRGHEKRSSYTSETNHVSQHIGHDRIHAVDFQPSQVLPVSLIIDPIIEQAHQQETIATADQHHRARPYLLDHRQLQAHSQPSATIITPIPNSHCHLCFRSIPLFKICPAKTPVSTVTPKFRLLNIQV